MREATRDAGVLGRPGVVRHNNGPCGVLQHKQVPNWTGGRQAAPPARTPSCLGAASWFTAWRENRLGQVRLAQVRPTTSPLVLGCACVRKARGRTQQQSGRSRSPSRPLQAPRSRAVVRGGLVTQRTLRAPRGRAEHYFAPAVSFANI